MRAARLLPPTLSVLVACGVVPRPLAGRGLGVACTDSSECESTLVCVDGLCSPPGDPGAESGLGDGADAGDIARADGSDTTEAGEVDVGVSPPTKCLRIFDTPTAAGEAPPNASVRQIATDVAGNVLVAGSFARRTDFGAGAVKGGAAEGGFLAKYAAGTCALAWAHVYFADEPVVIDRLAVDSKGSSIVAGRSSKPIDLGGGSVPAGIFVAKFDGTGAHVWSRSYGIWLGGPLGGDLVGGMVVEISGAIFIQGTYNGDLDLGTGAMPSGAGWYLAKFASTGKTLWGRGYVADPGTTGALPTATMVTASGHPIAMVLADGINFGGGGLKGAYAAEFSGSGTFIRATKLGASVTGGQVESSGGMLVYGQVLKGVFDMGGGAEIAPADRAIWARYDSSGKLTWSRNYGDPESPYAARAAEFVALPEGGFVGVGRFQRSIDFGFGLMVAADTFGFDGFVAKVDATGKPAWARQLRASKSGSAASIAIDKAGTIFLGGGFSEGTIELGGKVFSAKTGAGFLATFIP